MRKRPVNAEKTRIPDDTRGVPHCPCPGSRWLQGVGTSRCVCRHGRWGSRGQPPQGSGREMCHRENTASEQRGPRPQRPVTRGGDVLTADGGTEGRASGSPAWTGTQERRGDTRGPVLLQELVSPSLPWPRGLRPPPCRGPVEEAGPGPHLLPVGRDHADVTRRHLAGDAPGQQAAVAHDLDGFGRVEP